MSLFFAMFPIYLLGNFHCIGMCGPLVALLGKHPQRAWYLWGRIASFTLFGMLAGTLSESLQLFFRETGLSGFLSIVLGGGLVFFALFSRSKHFLPSWLGWISQLLELRFASLMTKNRWHATFLFGFLTLALPCGQSLMVLSTSALIGSPIWGALNALLFALLTSPSLWLAMEAHGRLRKYRERAEWWVCLWTVAVGLIGIWRGVVEWQAQM